MTRCVEKVILVNYDVPMRLVFNYFTMARCGDTTGKSWAGPCHLEDGNLVGVGHRDFSSGYHQMPGAVTIGLQPESFDPQHYGNCCANEYDMPPTGAALWLMAEQTN